VVVVLKAIFLGGRNIKRLMAETGVQVTPDADNSGLWTIFAPNRSVVLSLLNCFVFSISETSVFAWNLLHSVKGSFRYNFLA